MDAVPQIEGIEILKPIASGSFGTVFLGRQILLGRTVALKILSITNTSEKLLRRFQLEAKVGCALDHPNIAKMYSYGIACDGRPYLIFEYIEGSTLAQHLQQNGPLSSTEFIEIFKQVALALDYIHNRSIIIRDLKPQDIILSPAGNSFLVKLIDFGLVRLLREGTQPAQITMTSTLEFVGEPTYMSPERCANKNVDARSDIYSMACIMYQSLSGHPPFTAHSDTEMMMKHVTEEPSLLIRSKKESHVAPSLVSLISRCLRKLPQDRPASAREVFNSLERQGSQGTLDIKEKSLQLQIVRLGGILLLAGFCLSLSYRPFFRETKNGPNKILKNETAQFHDKSSFTARKKTPLNQLDADFLLLTARKESEDGNLKDALLNYEKALDLLNIRSKESLQKPIAEKLHEAALGKARLYWQIHGLVHEADKSVEFCLQNAIKNFGRNSYESVQAYCQLINLLIEKKDLEQAKRNALIAKALLSTQSNKHSSVSVWLMARLALIEYLKENYAKASKLANDAVIAYEDLLGEQDDATLWTKELLIRSLYKCNRKEKSWQHSEALINQLGKDESIDADICKQILEQLMNFYDQQNEFEKEELAGRQLCSILRRKAPAKSLTYDRQNNEALLSLYLKMASLPIRKELRLPYCAKAEKLLASTRAKARINELADIYSKLEMNSKEQFWRAQVSPAE